MCGGINMAEGGYDQETTNPFDTHGDGDNDRTPLIPHHEEGEEIGMKQRTPVARYPPTNETSTSKGGEHETSFIDSPSGEEKLRLREKEMEELKKDVRKVFPLIDRGIVPFIRRGDYDRLIINLGKKNSKDWVIAFDGSPSNVVNLAKFPKGIRKALGKTNIQINQENYERQKKEEKKQAKREQEQEKARRAKAENDEKLRDAEEREENLEKVVEEQEEAKKYALSTEDKESHARSVKASRNALRQVSTEVEGFRVERDRLEQAERNADTQVEEGERQVETARERVNERLLELRDRIKEIFKKHGFTVIAVATAIATVIGVIVSNLKAGLTKVAKGVGNGLKELGKKLGEILPGMIGAIASFIFRTAGEVIGFLAKNAWLLVVGLVVLAVEQFKKKSG